MPFFVCENCEIVEEAAGLGDKITERSLCKKKRIYHHRAVTISFLRENSGRQREASPRPRSPERRERGPKSSRAIDSSRPASERRVQSHLEIGHRNGPTSCAPNQPNDRTQDFPQKKYRQMPERQRSIVTNERQGAEILAGPHLHRMSSMPLLTPNKHSQGVRQGGVQTPVRHDSDLVRKAELIPASGPLSLSKRIVPSASASKQTDGNDAPGPTHQTLPISGQKGGMNGDDMLAITATNGRVQYKLPKRLPGPIAQRQTYGVPKRVQATPLKVPEAWCPTEEHLGIKVEIDWVFQHRRARLRQLDPTMPDMIFFFNELYHLARILNGYNSFCTNRNHVFMRLQSRMSILSDGADLSKEFHWFATLLNDTTRLYIRRMIAEVQEYVGRISSLVGLALTEVHLSEKRRLESVDKEETSVRAQHLGALFWLEIEEKPVARSKLIIRECVRSLATLSDTYFIEMAKVRSSVLEFMVEDFIIAHTKARWIRRAFFCLHLAQPKVQVDEVNGVRGLQHVSWPSLKRISDQLLGPIALHNEEADSCLYLTPDADLDSPLEPAAASLNSLNRDRDHIHRDSRPEGTIGRVIGQHQVSNKRARTG